MRWSATRRGASPPVACTKCAAPAGDDFMRPAWSSQRRLQLQVGRGPREPIDPSTRGQTAGLQPGTARTRLSILKLLEYQGLMTPRSNFW
nr:cAMP-dependent protein kinase inhibitor alpha isoform X2 [Peromyscus maniculatus bairdii]